MMSSAVRGLDFPSLWQRSKLGERVGVRARCTAPPRTPCSLERCGAARSFESIHPRQLARDRRSACAQECLTCRETGKQHVACLGGPRGGLTCRGGCFLTRAGEGDPWLTNGATETHEIWESCLSG